MKENTQNLIQGAISWMNTSRRKLATFGVGLLACVLAYHVIFGANGIVVYEHKQKEFLKLQEQNRILDQQNQGLEQQIKALKTDPQAIEKEAREGLRYAKRGEVIYTVTAPNQKGPEPTGSGGEKSK